MKEKQRPISPLEPAERDDVRVSTNRCPYCHDSVDIDADTWVSCRSCQARHHDACWTEGGACSSCGHEIRLVPDLAPENYRAAVEDPDAPHMWLPSRQVWKVGTHTVVCEMSQATGREAVWVDGALVSDRTVFSFRAEHQVPIRGKMALIATSLVGATLYVDGNEVAPLKGKAAKDAFQATLSPEQLRQQHKVAQRFKIAAAILAALVAATVFFGAG